MQLSIFNIYRDGISSIYLSCNKFGSNLIDTVVKYAFARLLAFVTRDATVNLQMSYVDHLCLDALLMQSGGHFGECAVSTARSVGTAINKKYFHIYKPIF